MATGEAIIKWEVTTTGGAKAQSVQTTVDGGIVVLYFLLRSWIVNRSRGQ